MKKLLSITMSLVMLVATLSMATFSANATTMKEAPQHYVGDTFNVTYDSLKQNTYEYYAKFVPTSTGIYEFKASKGVGKITGEVRFYIINSKGENVNSDYMDETFPDPISITGKLTKDHTYYFAISAERCGLYTSDITIKKHTHTIERVTSPAMAFYDSREPDFKMFDDGYVADICQNCVNFEEFELGYEKKISTIYSPKTMSLSYNTYSYNGKKRTPVVTIKDRKGNVISKSNYKVKYSNNTYVGTAVVTVDFKGDNYMGEMVKTFVINPAATKITGVYAKPKGFDVKWSKKTSQTTGYQVQYSTDKNFKKNKKTVTIVNNNTNSRKARSLKSKTKYFVRVRTYKTVKGTKYYSAWSSTKSVTTK